MSKRYCIFLSALFCAFLAVFLVAGAVSPDQSFSQLENRNLQQLPAPTVETVLSGKFMADFETYTTDQFPGRDAWVDLKARTEKAMGKQENNSVYFCKKDTLITRFDTPDAQNVASNLSYVDQFAQKAGVPVYFSLIPGAAEIWSDRLPEGAPNASQKAVIDQAASTLKTALVYDTYSALAAHSGEDIYYRTDHHWTSTGAYYAYQQLCDTLGLTPFDTAAHTVLTADGFYGTHYSKARTPDAEPDTITYYDLPNELTIYSVSGPGQPAEGETTGLYDTAKLDVYDKYAMFLHGNNGLSRIRGDGTGRILVIKDSYANCFVPYLTANYADIDVVDFRNYNYGLDKLIADNDYDQLLVLYSFDSFKSDPYLYRAGVAG